MMNKTARLILGLLLIAVLIVGCTRREILTGVGAAGVGAAAVYYHQAALRADLAYPMRDVFEASVDTMQARGYAVDADYGESRSRIRADAPADRDRDVRINLEHRAADVTRITIRVGLIGDEPLSRTFLDEIQQRLRATRTM